MRVCYFGIYDSNYPRNKTLMDGLRENGAEIIECNSREKGFKKIIELYKKHRSIKNDYDVMVVGYMGHLIMPLAKIISRKKIVFDAFLSVYDSMVYDRKVCSPYSLRAWYYFFLDWLSCRLADKVILDTNEHIKYFVNKFKIKKEKFSRIWIGAHNKIFHANHETTSQKEKFQVLWWGWMIPLHGMDFILQAAHILQGDNIEFILIGKGAERPRVEKIIKTRQLKNISVFDTLPTEKLLPFIRNADICLGIFGITNKTKMVIPNKVYEAFACQKAVVTGDTPAAREILIDKKHCLLCKTGSGEDLAIKIKYLKENESARKEIEKNAFDLYQKFFNQNVLGKEMLTILKQYVQR